MLLRCQRNQNIISGNFPLGSKHRISIVHTKKKSEPLKFPVAEVKRCWRFKSAARVKWCGNYLIQFVYALNPRETEISSEIKPTLSRLLLNARIQTPLLLRSVQTVAAWLHFDCWSIFVWCFLQLGVCSRVWRFLTSELVYWTEARMREEVTEEENTKTWKSV